MASLPEAIDQALKFLSYRPRSVKEVRQKLGSRGFSMEVIDIAVSELSAAGYLDDLKFARALASSRIRVKHWGRARISADLKEKGVPEEIAREALSPFDADEETATAQAAFRKWAKRLGPEKTLDKKDYARAFRHLQGRGFPASVITAVLKGRKDDTEE